MATEAKVGAPATPPVLPSPALPKGGGAIAPIGEKLVANPQSGTASFSVPVFTSSGRAGFGPKLQLSYDAGAGNGPFGIGWSLSVPNISRKTEKGLPRYDDASDADTFILSGVEDLVRVSSAPRGIEQVILYRPRVESDFARIERHLRPDLTSYWVVFTRDNHRSVYGFSSQAQLRDPSHPSHVFRWLLEWTDDDRGNVAAFVYKPEDDVNVPTTLPEQGRARTNQYLKAIAYGNAQPRSTREAPPIDFSVGRAQALAAWPLVVLFDYGEHDRAAPTLAEGSWPARADSFSSYRSGFEVRTHRLCQRILMLHRFDELGPAHVAVRSTELTHQQSGAISYLTHVTQVGWKTAGAGYQRAAMPALAFGYGEVKGLDHTVRTLDPADAENLPAAVDGSRYAFLDYDGEGLPGVLTEQPGGGWYYKRPEGTDAAGKGHFGPVRAIAIRPSAALAEGFQLQDVNGDGLIDLVRIQTKPEGVFERSAAGWDPVRAFQAMPNIKWSDPTFDSSTSTATDCPTCSSLTRTSSVGTPASDEMATAPNCERRSPQIGWNRFHCSRRRRNPFKSPT